MKFTSSTLGRALLVILLLVILGVGVQQMDRTLPDTQTTRTQTQTLSTIESEVEGVIDTYQPITVSIVATKDVQVLRRCSQLDPFSFFSPFGRPSRQCEVENQKVEVGGGT